jgi:hypothetical protein
MYKESSSSILMLLTNFSKDKFVIDSIINYTKSLFKNSPMANIGDDTDHFNELFSEIQKIIISNSTPSKSRLSSEKIEDKLYTRDEKEYNGSSIMPEEDDDDTKVDRFIKDLSSSVRCIDIIGQILKSQYGSLKFNQKEPLFAEAISLSLRALGDFYSFVKESKSLLLKDIEDEIEKRDITGELQISQLAKKIVMEWSTIMSFFFIMYPTRSFASENLQPIFKDYFSKNNTDNANNILSFAINLESSHRLNIDELKDLLTKLQNNVMSKTVLQRVIVNYLYMNRTNHIISSQVSSLLNISVKNQLVIDSYAIEKQIR